MGDFWKIIKHSNYKHKLCYILEMMTIILLITPLTLCLSLIAPLMYVYRKIFNIQYNDKTIVLIHGTGSNKNQWIPMRLWFYLCNYKTRAPNYYHSQPCQDSENDLYEYLKDHKNDIMIGHSQGGLLCIGLKDRLKPEKIFCMNTPCNGSKFLEEAIPILKSWKCSENDMKPNSKYIEKIQSISGDGIIHHATALFDPVEMDETYIHQENPLYVCFLGHIFLACSLPYFFHILRHI